VAHWVLTLPFIVAALSPRRRVGVSGQAVDRRHLRVLGFQMKPRVSQSGIGQQQDGRARENSSSRSPDQGLRSDGVCSKRSIMKQLFAANDFKMSGVAVVRDLFRLCLSTFRMRCRPKKGAKNV
jgi:hypothetical protein